MYPGPAGLYRPTSGFNRVCKGSTLGNPLEGVWNGPLDHSIAVSFAWDEEALYIGAKVFDDTEQVNDLILWNGDNLNVHLSGPNRERFTQIYYLAHKHAGGSGFDDDPGIVRQQPKPGGSKVLLYSEKPRANYADSIAEEYEMFQGDVTRNECGRCSDGSEPEDGVCATGECAGVTIYEMRIPAYCFSFGEQECPKKSTLSPEALAAAEAYRLEPGLQLGVRLSVADGDTIVGDPARDNQLYDFTNVVGMDGEPVGVTGAVGEIGDEDRALWTGVSGNRGGSGLWFEPRNGGPGGLGLVSLISAAPTCVDEQVVLPEVPARVELIQQSLALRHATVSDETLFGGGGTALGAVQAVESAVTLEYVDLKSLEQLGSGAAALFLSGAAAGSELGSTLSVAFCQFSGLSNRGTGGAVLHSLGSSATFSHVHVSSCSVSNEMGLPDPESAVLVAKARSTLVLDHARFVDSTGDVILADGSSVSVDHSSFADGTGGAVILAVNGAAVAIANSAVEANTLAATELARAPLTLWTGSVATITSSSFTGNAVTEYAGPTGRRMMFDAATGRRQLGHSGSVPELPGGQLPGGDCLPGWTDMDGSCVPPEPAPDCTSGAIFAVQNSRVVLTSVEFTSNVATSLTDGAGAVYVTSGATVDGADCTFTSNVANARKSAGGVYTEDANVTLAGTAFTTNRCDGHPTAGTVTGGGALYAKQSAVSCSHCVATDNTATPEGQGQTARPTFSEAFFVYEATSVKFLNATFSPLLDGAQTVTINPGNVNGRVAGGCEQHPCSPGESCSLQAFSLACEACPAETQSPDGLSCGYCAPGQGATADQTGCVDCPANTASAFGVCQACPDTQVVASDRASCDDCPASQAPVSIYNASERACSCAEGYVNASAVLSICFDAGYNEAEYADAISDFNAQLGVTGDCQVCTTDSAGQPCVDCSTPGGAGPIMAGYTVPQLTATDGEEDARLVFRCHDEWDLAVARCPAAAAPGVCAEGYDGLLCQSCAEDYGMTPSRTCEPCSETGFTSGSLIILLVIVAVLVAVGGLVAKCWHKVPGKHLVRCAFVPFRILVTYAQVSGGSCTSRVAVLTCACGQVVTQLGDVLSFPYPPLFNGIINALRPIIDVWGVLFRLIGLSSECVGLVGFGSRWVMRILMLPLLMCAIVAIVYVVERCTGGAKAGSHARGNLFLVTFFVYPTICAVSFQSFLCKTLKAGVSVLEADDNTFCEDDNHGLIQVLSTVVIIVFALGLPLTLLHVLTSKTRAYSKSSQAEDKELAAQVSLTQVLGTVDDVY